MGIIKLNGITYGIGGGGDANIVEVTKEEYERIEDRDRNGVTYFVKDLEIEGTVIDEELSEVSENPVQNRVIKEALDGKLDSDQLKNEYGIEEGSIPTIESKVEENSETLGYVKSKNLFDGIIEIGSINPDTGDLVEANDRIRSANFIKVQPNSQYTIRRRNNLTKWVVGYDENKIGVTDSTAVEKSPSALAKLVTGLFVHTFTTTPTTHYIKWYDTQILSTADEIMINEGAKALPYTPYKPSVDERINTVSSLANTVSSLTNENAVTLGYSKGYNLFDYDQRIKNRALAGNNTGDDMPSTQGWYLSPYIPVKPNTAYTISNYSSNFTVQYDTNMQYIPDTELRTDTFTTTSNTRYVRFNSLEGAIIMFNEGATALPYEPYKPSVDERLNEKISVIKVANGGVNTSTLTINDLSIGMYIFTGYGAATASIKYKPVAYLAYISSNNSGDVMIDSVPLHPETTDTNSTFSLSITGTKSSNIVTVTYDQSRYHLLRVVKIG